jgi:4,5-dihydroxyphthalate decarboxylase
MTTTQEALKLNVMVGDYPNTVALTQGKVASDRLQLDFAEAKVPHDHFKAVVKGDFDVAELAIMTYLQAISWGRPLVALPVVLHGRFQHAQIAYNAERGTLAPADLHGKRVGVRTYAQTTPTWVRGILQNDYGVDLSKIHFITFGDGHVPEYRDPPNCERSSGGKKLLQMLLDGDVDAAVLSGDDLKHPKVKGLIPDPAACRESLACQIRRPDGQPHRGREVLAVEVRSRRGARGLPSAQGKPQSIHRAGAQGRHRQAADRLFGKQAQFRSSG